MIMKHINGLFDEEGLSRSAEKIKFYIQRGKYINEESSGNHGTVPFAHVTYCVASNAGDTVLSQCVRRAISLDMKASGWKIIPVLNTVSNDTIDEINKCGMLVIGGGGLFLPDTNKNSISGWQWAISEEQLKRINVPICVFSVGYNYFRGQEANELFMSSLRELVKKSSFVGLRNMGSINAISNLLPPELSSKICYQPCTTTLIRKIFGNELPVRKESGSIAVNMAFDRENLRFGENKDKILNQVAHAVEKIARKGYHIFYVCHCWDDDKFLPYLKSNNVKYELVDLSQKFPADVYNFYNNMDLVLGMRGHAQMIPFGLNCEIISLGTHDKMKWFLNDIDAADWYIDLSIDINEIADRIYDRFCQLHERNRMETINRLYDAQKKLWKITKDNLARIESLPIM